MHTRHFVERRVWSSSPFSFVITVIPAFLGTTWIGLTHGLLEMGYMIPTSSHLRISSLTASHTLGFSRLCTSLEGRESSSRKMWWVHKERSIPLTFNKFHPIASFLPRKTANSLYSWSWSSCEDIITGLAQWWSRKAYFNVEGSGFSSGVVSLEGNGSSSGSSKLSSSSIQLVIFVSS